MCGSSRQDARCVEFLTPQCTKRVSDEPVKLTCRQLHPAADLVYRARAAEEEEQEAADAAHHQHHGHPDEEGRGLERP